MLRDVTLASSEMADPSTQMSRINRIVAFDVIAKDGAEELTYDFAVQARAERLANPTLCESLKHEGRTGRKETLYLDGRGARLGPRI